MKPISTIDPLTNQLFFRGINATKLCGNSSFERVLHLLIHGQLPSHQELVSISERMVELRSLYDSEFDSLFKLAWSLERIKEDYKLNLNDTLLTFVSLAPLVVANEYGIAWGKMMKKPKKQLGHVANFLWMTKGVMPTETELDDFQTSLILHMDDPQNPSLSTLEAAVRDGKSISDIFSSTLNVHVEPLHHGAGYEAMMMFQEIKEQANVRKYLEQRLKSGGKIFGLGHRIYRGIDPRAVVLREMLERRTLNTKNEWLLKVSDSVAKYGRLLLSEYKGIDAYPNVDLYNAAVYFTFGFPPELNTPLFSISRSAGWMAHILDLSKSD
ncbi:MAG: citrate/2-methylcitrate synthase [Candidatus Thorarchaeota archaeon SMTZ1-45]|nr:MAG: hypothetical protein AM325_12860 [Candidatus Thorarchaeota archaeon SMTZ1-45]